MFVSRSNQAVRRFAIGNTSRKTPKDVPGTAKRTGKAITKHIQGQAVKHYHTSTRLSRNVLTCTDWSPYEPGYIYQDRWIRDMFFEDIQVLEGKRSAAPEHHDANADKRELLYKVCNATDLLLPEEKKKIAKTLNIRAVQKEAFITAFKNLEFENINEDGTLKTPLPDSHINNLVTQWSGIIMLEDVGVKYLEQFFAGDTFFIDQALLDTTPSTPKEKYDYLKALVEDEELHDRMYNTAVKHAGYHCPTDGTELFKQLASQGKELAEVAHRLEHLWHEALAFPKTLDKAALYEDKRKELDNDTTAWFAACRDPTSPAEALCSIKYWKLYDKRYNAPTKRMLNLMLTDIIPNFFKDDEDFKPWKDIQMRPSLRMIVPEDRQKANQLVETFEQKLKAKYGKDLKASCSSTCSGASCPCWDGTMREWVKFSVKRQELQPGWPEISPADYAKIQSLDKPLLDAYDNAWAVYEKAMHEHGTDVPEYLPKDIVSAYEEAKEGIFAGVREKYPGDDENKTLLLKSYYRGKITINEARQARVAIQKGDYESAKKVLDKCGPVKFRGIDYDEEPTKGYFYKKPKLERLWLAPWGF